MKKIPEGISEEICRSSSVYNTEGSIMKWFLREITKTYPRGSSWRSPRTYALLPGETSRENVGRVLVKVYRGVLKKNPE